MTNNIHDLEPNFAKALAKQRKLKQNNQGKEILDSTTFLVVNPIRSL